MAPVTNSDTRTFRLRATSQPAAIEALEQRRLLAAIGIDRNWGNEGFATPYTGESEYDFETRQLVNVDRHGNLLTARWDIQKSRLQRILANGQTDQTFLRPLAEGIRSGVARVDNLDRILVAGNVNRGTTVVQVLLTRYLQNGQLDKTFNGKGTLTVALPASIEGQTINPTPHVADMAIDSQRRAWVLLNVQATGLSPSVAARNQFYVLARYTENGTLDTRFGNQGRLLLNLGTTGLSRGGEIRLLKRDHAYITLIGGKNIEVVGLDASGRRQKGYADQGRLRLPAAVRDQVRLPNFGLDGVSATVDTAGRLYVAIDAPLDSASKPVGYSRVARIGTNGSLDVSFGNAGYATLQSAKANRVRPAVGTSDIYRLQIDDAGRLYTIGDGGFARFTPDGHLDTTFDDDGLVTIGSGGSTANLNGLLPARDTTDPNAFFAVTYFNRVRRYRTETTGLDADGQLHVIADPTSQTVDIRARADGRVRVQVGKGVAYFSGRAIRNIVVYLTDGNDVFTANVGAPIKVFAGNGNDLLRSISSTDYDTGAGNDTVIAGDAKDTVTNSHGQDTINLGAGSGKVIAYSGGVDTGVHLTATPKSGQEVSAALGLGNDTVHISGGGRGTVNDGGGTLNRIYVESTPTDPARVSTEDARSGRFFITTGAGNDTIIAGSGRDQIDSGAGNDLIHKLAGPSYISAGEGDDSVRGGAGMDEIHGGPGNDTLRGNAGRDRIHGGDGNDRLFGNDGIDTLLGGSGNDSAVTDDDDVIDPDIELLD